MEDNALYSVRALLASHCIFDRTSASSAVQFYNKVVFVSTSLTISWIYIHSYLLRRLTILRLWDVHKFLLYYEWIASKIQKRSIFYLVIFLLNPQKRPRKRALKKKSLTKSPRGRKSSEKWSPKIRSLGKKSREKSPLEKSPREKKSPEKWSLEKRSLSVEHLLVCVQLLL